MTVPQRGGDRWRAGRHSARPERREVRDGHGDAEADRVIGIDIGGTNIRAGLLGETGLIATLSSPHRHSPYDTTSDYEQSVTVVRDLVDRLRDQERRDVKAIGVSIAGVVSKDRATLISNEGLGWAGRPLAADIAAACGVPAIMENDGNCASWAEYKYGVGRGHDPFVLLNIGTGIGGGIVIDGRLLVGAHGHAGELGHVCVEPGGRHCACGAIGCLEAYASGRALIEAFGEAEQAGEPQAGDLADRSMERHTSLQSEFVRRVRSADPRALALVDDLAARIADGVSALVRIVDPAMLAIGGGVSSLGAPLLDATRRALSRYPAGRFRRLDLAVELASFGADAGVLGAAMLCLQADASPGLAGARIGGDVGSSAET